MFAAYNLLLLLLLLICTTCTQAVVTSKITLVTAFFPLEHAKHTPEEYDNWNARFIQHIKCPTVLYVPKILKDHFKALRGDLPITIRTQYDHPFEFSRLQDKKDILIKQHDMDPEASIHNPDLYAIWDGKAVLLQEAALENVYGSEYFLWVDIGYFRELTVENWPDYERWEDMIRDVPKDSFFHFAVDAFPVDVNGDHPLRLDILMGGLFGGTEKAINWWTRTLYLMIDEFIEKNEFVGKDQCLYNALALRHPTRVAVVPGYICAFFNQWWMPQYLLARSDFPPPQLAKIISLIKASTVLDLRRKNMPVSGCPDLECRECPLLKESTAQVPSAP